MTTTTTRRALIGGAGLAAVVAAVPAIAVVRAPAASTAKWDALVAAFQKADATMKALGIKHTAASDRYYAEVAKLGERPVEPKFTYSPTSPYPRPMEHMTIAEITATPLEKSPEYLAYEAALTERKALTDALSAAITDDIEAQWEAAVDAQDTAAHALFSEPSPNADALSFKLDLVQVAYQGCDLSDDVTAAIFADVRRFLSREA